VWSFTTNDGNAFDPEPTDNGTRVPLDANLSWQPGCFFVSHNVYFSTDYNEVANRQAGAFLGNTSSSTIDPCAGDLEYFTRYYWAVDEVGSPTYQGPVWSFRTRAEVQDPNILLWYKFDETEGDSATDWSGNEFSGDVNGVDANTWDSDGGQYGGSIYMDGGQRVDVPMGAVSLIGDKEVSVSLWFKGAGNPDEANWIFSLHGGITGFDDEWDLKAAIPDSAGGVRFVAGARPEYDDEPEENDSNDVLQWTEDEGAAPGAWEAEWHHLVFMKNENVGTMSIYFDGVLVEQRSDVYTGTLAEVKAKAQRFAVGAHVYHQSGHLLVRNTYNGKIDDFRIYDYALSDADVELLFRAGNLGPAWAPSPSNGHSDVQRDVVLTWKQGAYATHHDVYFGTSWDDVNDANTNDSVYKPPRLAIGTETYNPGGLELGTTYYWRVDEVNTIDPNLWRGPIWRFTVANYIVVDDFESYDMMTNLITGTWLDGIRMLPYPPYFEFVNGATVTLGASYADPPTPVHGGSQSMEYVYDNSYQWDGISYWSLAELPFGGPEDWTDYEVKALTLYFHGDPNNDTNDTEQLYVAVDDDLGGHAEIPYPDMNDLKKHEWTEWNVAISDFNSPDDVDETKVTSLSIIFGSSSNTTIPGGFGIAYFDDIRLYSRRCVPSIRKPVADLSGDCTVDFVDVEILGDEWLETDRFVAVSEPNTGPVGEWKLDGTAADTGSGGNHGTLQGSYQWVAGHDGSAVEFFFGRVLVSDAAVLRPQNEVSVCAWINYSTNQNNSRVVVKGRDNWETYVLRVDDDDSLTFQINEDTPGPNEPNTYETKEDELYMDDWVHIAGTYDGTLMKIFVNGEVVDDTDDANGITLSQAQTVDDGLAIGGRADSDDNTFEGIVDEVRVYDYALTEAEVAYVALGPTGYRALVSIANVYDTESPGSKAVNLRDFAVMATEWLTPEEDWIWPDD
jgi:hypothetical protein